MAHHVLIVDADASAAQVTAAGVMRALPDASLTIVPSPERGRSSLRCLQPDVLIVDPSPNTLTAMALIRLVKAEYPACCVVVLTSAPRPVLRRDLMRLGVDVYVEKPAPLELLIQQLRAVTQETPLHPPVPVFAHEAAY